MASERPSRTAADLNRTQRQLLEDAHAALRVAVAAYDDPVVSGAAIREARAQVEAAEEWIWSLRQRLLGWHRPAWVPSASLVRDWFSDEDADYDQLS